VGSISGDGAAGSGAVRVFCEGDTAIVGEASAEAGGDVLRGERAASGRSGAAVGGDDTAVHGEAAGQAGGGSMHVGWEVEAGVGDGDRRGGIPRDDVGEVSESVGGTRS